MATPRSSGGASNGRSDPRRGGRLDEPDSGDPLLIDLGDDDRLDPAPSQPESGLIEAAGAGGARPGALELVGRAPPHGAPTPSPPFPPVEAPVRRDRIVILGRRTSGKTVYLSRLYERLFRGEGAISAVALDGRSHLRCAQVLDELSQGRWPAATGETSVIALELKFPGGTERLVALDYPGEVFRRAFVDEVLSPEVAALMEHVDRAAALILLIDPGAAVGVSATERADNDFGMIQAVRRLRSTDSGRKVPVAVLFTKLDAHAPRIRAMGGLKSFVQTSFPALARSAAGAKVFGCAAVRTTIDPFGRRLPQVRGEPVGVVEPIAWCLESMGVLRHSEARAQQRREEEEAAEQALLEDLAAARRERRILMTVWIVALVLLAVGALVLFVVLDQGARP